MKTLKAVLIDPTLQACADVPLDAQDSYRQIRNLVGCETAGTFYPNIVDVPGYDGRFICWIDDNGYLSDEVKPLWEIAGYAQPLTGRGLLVGLDDEEGDHIDCPLSAEIVEQLITWRTDIEFVGMVTETTMAPHPLFDQPIANIITKTVFRPKEKTDE